MSNLQKTKFAVIGGGSWATAIVKLLCNSQSNVGWWMRNEDAVSHIQQFKHNPNYLQSVEFDLTKLSISSNLESIISNTEIVIIATPAAFLTKTFENIPSELIKDKIVFSAVSTLHLFPSLEYYLDRVNILLQDQLLRQREILNLLMNVELKL